MRALGIFGIIVSLSALFFMIYAGLNRSSANEQEFIALIDKFWFPAFVIGLFIAIGANAAQKVQEKRLLQGKKKDEKMQ